VTRQEIRWTSCWFANGSSHTLFLNECTHSYCKHILKSWLVTHFLTIREYRASSGLLGCDTLRTVERGTWITKAHFRKFPGFICSYIMGNYNSKIWLDKARCTLWSCLLSLTVCLLLSLFDKHKPEVSEVWCGRGKEGIFFMLYATYQTLNITDSFNKSKHVTFVEATMSF